MQLVYITVPDHENALALARGMVECGLAAGANVAGPVTSFYRWQGEIRKADEWQIFAQTDNFAGLRDWAAERHPHLVPCIVGIDIAVGHAAFLNWIRINSSGSGECRQP